MTPDVLLGNIRQILELGVEAQKSQGSLLKRSAWVDQVIDVELNSHERHQIIFQIVFGLCYRIQSLVHLSALIREPAYFIVSEPEIRQEPAADERGIFYGDNSLFLPCNVASSENRHLWESVNEILHGKVFSDPFDTAEEHDLVEDGDVLQDEGVGDVHPCVEVEENDVGQN